MKIGIACDHGGLDLKGLVKETLAGHGCEVLDLGTDAPESVDYPDYAQKALSALACGECDRIVLICGTGIGMSICANRVPGVRGTLCHDAYTPVSRLQRFELPHPGKGRACRRRTSCTCGSPPSRGRHRPAGQDETAEDETGVVHEL